MLAKSYDDYKEVVADHFKAGDTLFLQPKLDGMRMVKRLGHLLQSRGGKPIVSVPHIDEIVQSLLEADPVVVLDGEGYADKFKNDFNSIISNLRKTKPTDEDLAESARTIDYHVYDLFVQGESAMSFANRHQRLVRLHGMTDAICLRLGCRNPIKLVETIEVKSVEQIEKQFAKWRMAGYEGAMIRVPLSPYECGRRSQSLLKYKVMDDAEFLVIDVEEGVGNRSGMAGALVFRYGEKVFRAAPQGTDAAKRQRE